MGHSHYFHQRKTISRAAWAEIVTDVKGILNDVQHNQGIVLSNDDGEPGTQPIVSDEIIAFNGSGDQCCESLWITRVIPKDRHDRVWFCKVYDNPYGLAVMAVLAYLDTVAGTHQVGSDGDGQEWLDGVEQVRRGAPRAANIVDIPLAILKKDRWVSPIYIKQESSKYNFRFCIDGKAYIYRVADEEAYVFETHMEAIQWAAPHMAETFSPSGWFDQARSDRIKRRQNVLLGDKFEERLWEDGRAGKPPAIARPNTFPPFEVTPVDWRTLLEPSRLAHV